MGKESPSRLRHLIVHEAHTTTYSKIYVDIETGEKFLEDYRNALTDEKNSYLDKFVEVESIDGHRLIFNVKFITSIHLQLLEMETATARMHEYLQEHGTP